MGWRAIVDEPGREQMVVQVASNLAVVDGADDAGGLEILGIADPRAHQQERGRDGSGRQDTASGDQGAGLPHPRPREAPKPCPFR